MSFGVGDFALAIKLANKLRKAFVGAPAQCNALSDQVRSLSIVLQDAEIVSSEQGLRDGQQAELCRILDGSHQVLSQLDKTLSENIEVVSTSRGLGNRAKRVWKRLSWDNEDILELRGRITSSVTLLHAFIGQISSGVVFETKKGVDRLNQRHADQDRLDILDWLTSTDYFSHQNDFIQRRQAGTGQWLLDSSEYNKWLHEAWQILFCPGIPGAGKTILTSIVIDDLVKRFQDDQNVGIAYVFCNFRRQDEQTIDHILLSLLKQLAQAQSALPEAIAELYHRHRVEKTRPQLEEILKVLQSVTDSHYARVFIIIDALDECSAYDGCRSRLLSALSNLRDTCNANVFATSREIPEITDEFDKDMSLEIRASKEDVKRYLDGHLLHLPSFVRRSSDLQREVVAEIVDSVDGMFLLAQLHLDSLKGKRSPKALRVALKSLATGSNTYDVAYEEAMGRIAYQSKDEEELAMQALSWITCARRPLTTGELQHALAVEADECQLDLDNISQIEDIVSVCAGLVTVDEQSNVVRLVHYTVQEYFERSRARWFPEAEADITNVCLTYLSFSAFESGPCGTVEELETRLEQYSLYSYSARSWGHHARAAGPKTYWIHGFLRGSNAHIEEPSQTLSIIPYDYVVYYCRQQYPTGITWLHLAGHFGLEHLADQLLGISSNGLDAKDSYGQTPLFLAAGNGHTNFIRCLVNKGAQIDVEDQYGQTAFSWAVRRGQEPVVRLLLEIEANFESKGQRGLSSITWAVLNGHGAIVKLLLEKGANIELRDAFGSTLLSQAAMKGHKSVVKILIEKGADLESTDGLGRPPLYYATTHAYEAIVELLLGGGANIESKDEAGQTSLSVAALCNQDGVARVLLERGANLESRDIAGWTPISWAAFNGRKDVLRLLLDSGADFESRDNGGQTPLSLAAEEGFGDVAKMLLERGADFESRDIAGRTPITWAAMNGHEDVVKLLLDKGANFESKNEDGQTPMSLATEEGHEGVVKLLLQRGASRV